MPMLLLAALGAQIWTCGPDRPMPPYFANWNSPVALANQVQPGSAVTVPLQPDAQVRFALPPARPIKPDGYGSVTGLQIARAGRYRVHLSAPAWIDLVRGGQAVASSAHQHGSVCTGVAKQVEFDLQPGRYMLQLSGAPAKSLKLLVSEAPD